MNMNETTVALGIARDNMAKVMVSILMLGAEMAKLKTDIVLTDSEYAGLKNEGLRTAHIEKLLADKYAVARGLEVDKILAGNELAKAEDNNRLAKYLIIQAAGKIVA